MRSLVTPLRSPGALIILAVFALTLAACGRGAGSGGPPEKGVIRLSIFAPRPARTERQDWRAILSDMASRTGLKVEASYFANPGQAVEALRRGKTDAGWFSNESGLQAVRRGGGEVFARVVGLADDEAYQSLLIVRARSRLTLERVLTCDRRLTLGLGDGSSASGALAPMAYLFAPRDIDPKICFRQVRRASAAANISGVADGRLDAASTNALTLRQAQAAARPEAGEVRVIWRSPALPQDPIIWRRRLDPGVKEKLRQFFLTYGRGQGPQARRQRANLAKVGAAGFLPADDDHLLPVREMEAAAGWGLAKQSHDPNKIAAARKALDNIRAQREALEGRTRAPAAAQ